MNATETYLHYDGTCAQAMTHYAKLLGGSVHLMRYGEVPGGAPLGSEDRIVHARLEHPGGVILAGDYPKGMNYPGMHGFYVSLFFEKDDATVKRLYDALLDGGEAQMPLQKTFYSNAFAMLVDRYGTPWMLRS